MIECLILNTLIRIIITCCNSNNTNASSKKKLQKFSKHFMICVKLLAI